MQLPNVGVEKEAKEPEKNNAKTKPFLALIGIAFHRLRKQCQLTPKIGTFWHCDISDQDMQHSKQHHFWHQLALCTCGPKNAMLIEAQKW